MTITAPKYPVYLSTVTEIGDGSWRNRRNCAGADPAIFFPERGESLRAAEVFCQACVVRGDCLEYAIVNNERSGVWGGTSERQRRQIRRVRALTFAVAASSVDPDLEAELEEESELEFCDMDVDPDEFDLDDADLEFEDDNVVYIGLAGDIEEYAEAC